MTVEPLVPAHIDLRDFPFMPLEVARLRDSAIVDEISGDEFRAAILLWCASWHQVPAGSLPNDPKQLSKFAGYGRVVTEWDKVAEGALYGWVECSDGRLYHPVVAEKAIEAWEKKAEFTSRAASRAEQAKAAAGAKWGESQNKQNRSQRLAEARAKAKHTDEEWRSLLALFDNACVRCGSHERIVKDHITPIYQGGSDGIENLQPLCHSCNSAKGPDRTDHRDTVRPGWRTDFDTVNGTPAETPAGLTKTPAKRLPKGKGEGQGQGEAATHAGACEATPSRPTITTTAEFAAWIRTLVGQEPVLFAHDTQSLARLLDEGCTLADVEAGIAAAMAKPDFRPRQWSQLAGWVRGAAKDRLEAEAKAAPPARSVAKPPVDPDQDRRNRLAKATAHFRGQWRQGWPEEMLPGHSACTTEADVIEEARLAVEREAAVYANGLPARRDRNGRAAA